MTDTMAQPAARLSTAKQIQILVALLVLAALIYGGVEFARVAYRMMESEKNLHSTLYTFALVEQFVKTEKRWPRSWNELEDVVMPAEPGRPAITIPYQMPLTEVQQRVLVDFEADIDAMTGQSPQAFTAIKPNGTSYSYDKGQIETLQDALRDVSNRRKEVQFR